MELHLAPELARKLNDLAATTGRAREDLVHEALVGYMEQLASLRTTLDDRYDDLKSGRVKPMDGEEALGRLREQSDRRRRLE
jgi:predicted DNA-binding protein